MTYTIGFLSVLLLIALVAMSFARADAAKLASAIRFAGPMLLGLVGVVMLLAGRAGLGGMLISGAVAWFGSSGLKRPRSKSSGKKSHVRSAALEMELDHDSGTLSGVVLAGRYEGKTLAQLSLEELLDLHSDLVGDTESLQLLEAYLDSRFPVWRDSADTNQDGRERNAPRPGPITKEEAYKVLGLEAGASATEIRQAHRRLMQRLHPDMGGSAFLAARINEARDVLLSDHR